MRPLPLGISYTVYTLCIYLTITATEVQNIPDKEDMPLSQTERQLTATMAQMADGLAVNAAASDCYSEYEQTYVWP
mgnify:CR=1 FL=1